MSERHEKIGAVLVFIDDPDLAESIRLYLEDSYQVYLLSDPVDLKIYLARYNINILLTDLDTTGVGQLQQLPGIKSEYPQLKIIVMYMFLDEEERKEKPVLNVADDIILKPFSAGVLKYKLDRLLLPAAKKSLISF
jgi:DNA-binding response OmpR family regulator